jgi:hypothetical protein
MAMYKQKCAICKKNFVLMSGHGFPICYDCQKQELQGAIKDPEMKKMFDIPEEFYRQSYFLRSIKVNYLKFGKLTEKQIEAFKKVVKEMKQA